MRRVGSYSVVDAPHVRVVSRSNERRAERVGGGRPSTSTDSNASITPYPLVPASSPRTSVRIAAVPSSGPPSPTRRPDDSRAGGGERSVRVSFSSFVSLVSSPRVSVDGAAECVSEPDDVPSTRGDSSEAELRDGDVANPRGDTLRIETFVLQQRGDDGTRGLGRGPPDEVDVVEDGEGVDFAAGEERAKVLSAESERREHAGEEHVGHDVVEGPRELAEDQRLHLEHTDAVEADVHVFLERVAVDSTGFLVEREGGRRGGRRV